MTSTRIVECPCCGGEGGYGTFTGIDARNGEPLGYWTTCDCCNGRREVEIEAELMTLDDATELDAESFLPNESKEP